MNRYSGKGDADFELDSSAVDSTAEVCDYIINRYHRFETFTTFQKAKDNFCGTSTSHDGIYKVNILIDRLLDVNKIYQINLGGNLGIRYCKILNRDNGKGDSDFDIDGSNIGNPTNMTCIIDSDNDGIEDSQDHCPNDAGPPSNNGCPGNSELSIVLNGSSITSDCFNCPAIFSQIGTIRHFSNRPAGITNISVLVQNTGNISSNSGTVGIYLSANSTYESSDTLIKSFNIPSIGNNNTQFSSGALFIEDFNSVTGNFWLIFRVDDSESNQESDESNNTFSIKYRVN